MDTSCVVIHTCVTRSLFIYTHSPNEISELLHDMWIKYINISTIKIKMSQDTLTKLITVVINICFPAIGLFCPFGIFKLFFCHNQ
jgi:hypothetical protein